MASNPIPYVSPEQYLQLERKAEYKSEYHDGQIFAMAGASENHIRLVKRLGTLLDRELAGSECEAFPTDMRVEVSGGRNYLYPDVVIVCGKRIYDDVDNLTNPVVIIEVLSNSTEAYDRGDKFALYRSIASLREYVLVAQKRMAVEIFTRNDDASWTLHTVADDQDFVKLSTVQAQFSLSELYRDVVFDQSW